jgi:hypothetical protein
MTGLAAGCDMTQDQAQAQAQVPSPSAFETMYRVGALAAGTERGWEEFAIRQSNPVYSFGTSPQGDICG